MSGSNTPRFSARPAVRVTAEAPRLLHAFPLSSYRVTESPSDNVPGTTTKQYVEPDANFPSNSTFVSPEVFREAEGSGDAASTAIAPARLSPRLPCNTAFTTIAAEAPSVNFTIGQAFLKYSMSFPSARASEGLRPEAKPPALAVWTAGSTVDITLPSISAFS